MSTPGFHVVEYAGPFGFIRPWTAVRDETTYSQQFLTPSIIEGMRRKLGVGEILRHKLRHAGVSRQQETTQAAAWSRKKKGSGYQYERATGILTRGVLLRPRLLLAFADEEDAERASREHLCLCRNEDLVFPTGRPRHLTEAAFDEVTGFELRFGNGPDAIPVGYHRYEPDRMTYGRIEITGRPAEPEIAVA